MDTLVETLSVNLDQADPANFRYVVLSGDSLVATAHLDITGIIDTTLTGDTLSASGRGSILIGGAGDDLLLSSGEQSVLVAGTGYTTLSDGSGDSTLDVTDPILLPQYSLQGGSGTDLLVIESAGVISDAALAKASGIEMISLNGASGLTLGTAALKTGIQSVFGGDGDSTYSQEAKGPKVLTLIGGAGNDSITVATAKQLAVDSIVGGDGIDTLQVLSAVQLGSTAFSSLSEIELLVMAGAGSVTLGDGAVSAGLSTVIGGTGLNTFVQTAGAFLLDGAVGKKNQFTVGSGALLASDTLIGGTGTDTLLVGQADSLDDSVFANVSSVEVLKLTGASSVTLDAAAMAAGISLVAGGDGGSTLTQTAGNTGMLSLAGGLGDDLFVLQSAGLLVTDSVNGDKGKDTLWLQADALFDSAVFSRIKGLEALSLSGASGVTLGSAALKAGIQSVFGGDGDSTYSQEAKGPKALTLTGGAGNDSITVATAKQLAADSLVGGDGIDTLQVLSPVKLGQPFFSTNSGIEVLIMAGSGSVSLGDEAASGGLSTVIGGTGLNTFVQTAGAFLLDGSAGKKNQFTVGSAALLASDTLIGGTGADTLLLNQEENIDDSLFSNVTSVDVLKMTGASSVTLDAAAMAAGISLVAGGDGGSTITQTAGHTGAMSLFGGKGDDLFVFTTANPLGTDSVNGDKGKDTLWLQADALLDSAVFSRIKGLEALSLTGASGVTLGSAALKAGIQSVFGGDGDSTYSQEAKGPKALTLTGGAGNDSITVATAKQLAADSLVGGDGIDTLQVLSPVKLGQKFFSRSREIEVLIMAGSGSVTLGDEAATGGLSTVVGGTGLNTFVQTAGAYLMDGSAGKKNQFTVGSGALLASDTLIGGTGTDTILVSQADNLDDSVFANVTSVEVLKLTGESSVTLDAAAMVAGINQVIGANGPSTITQTAALTNAVSMTGGKAADLFVLENGDLLASDFISGGKGNDTIWIQNDAAIDDSVLRRVKGVEFLSLTGSSEVTLDANASKSGIMSVYGGDGDSTYVHGAKGPKKLTIAGGAGNDLFSVANGKQLGGDSLWGGDGIDTLQIVSSAKFNKKFFSRVQGIEILSLGGAANSLSLGDNSSEGFATLVGGLGSNTFYQTGGSYYLDGSSAESNLFSILGASLVAGDTLLGGAGVDTLAISVPDTIDDTTFPNVTGVEILALTGASSVSLDAVSVAGFSTVLGGNGSSTYAAASSPAGDLFVFAGSGNDLFNLASSDLLAGGYTLSGGGGTNTLQLEAAASLDDSAFANLSGMTAFSLGSGDINYVTLDAAAAVAGVRSVFATDDGVNFTQGEGATLALTLVGGAGDDSFTINDARQLRKDSLTGGDGSNSLFMVSAAGGKILDNDFAGVSGFSTLSLGDSFSAALGPKAALAGISTVVAAVDGVTLDASGFGNTLFLDAGAASSGSAYLRGSSDMETQFLISGAAAAATSTIIGGRALDTLSILNADTFGDDAFAGMQSIDILALGSLEGGGASDVTMGANAYNAGILTVTGGIDGSTLTHLEGQQRGLFIDGSAASAGITANLFQFDQASLMALDTILGSGLGDTLTVINPDNLVSDISFANITGVSLLSLGSEASVTLDIAASAAGILSVTGGSDSLRLYQTTANGAALYIDGSANANGGNLFSFDASALLAANTLTGSSNADTVAILGADTFDDTAFANVSGISVLSLTGVTSVTLDAAGGNAGITSVFGGADSLEFYQGLGNTNALYIDGSANANGGNLFSFDASALLASGTLLGSGASESLGDTLVIAAADTFGDEVFANVTGIASLSLTGASAVTLDAAAAASGIASLYGGDDTLSFHHAAGGTTALYVDGSANSGGGNIFSYDNLSLLAADTIVSSGNGDAVAIMQASSLGDEVFGNLAGIAVLSLTGASAVTIDAAAAAAGIASVFGGDDTLSFLQLSGDPNAVYVDGAANANGGNLFLFESAALLAANTVLGSANADTIAILNPDALDDTVFTNVAGISALSLTGASVVSLDAAAGNAGITSVFGGDDTLSYFHTDGNSNALFVDGGRNGNGGNLFAFGSAALLAADTLVGSSNADTVVLLNPDALDDSAFANMTGISALSLTGSSSVTLDATADASGITSVFGGDDTLSFYQTTGETRRLYIDGSANANGGNIYTFDDVSLLAADTIVSSSAGDILAITQGAVLEDSLFANLAGITVLSLAGSSSVMLGTEAGNAGIASVFGGDDTLFIRHAAGDSNPVYIDGSANGNGGNLFQFDSAALLAADSIVGTANADTVSILNPDMVDDSAFANAAGISALVLSGASAVTLDAAASASGIASVFGGDGGLSLTQGSGEGNALFIDATSATMGGNQFVIDTAAAMAADTIAGSGASGSLGDTLTIANADTLDDTAFANLTGISALSLSGASAVTLDAAAAAAGFASVFGGGDTLSFLQGSGNATPLYIDGSANGNGGNVFAFDALGLLLENTLVTSGNGDILAIIQGDQLDDTVFSRLEGISVLSLGGASAVTMGAAAAACGIASVFGGDDSLSYRQEASNGGSVLVDGSGNGNGGNLFSLATIDQLFANTLVGSSNNDTLEIMSRASIEDASFANVTGISVLSMTGVSSVTLDALAGNVGILSVFGGGDTLSAYHGAGDATALFIDGSGNGNGGNLFAIEGAALLASDTLVGSGLEDTLFLALPDILEDTSFANVTGIPAISLSGASAVTLDSAAMTAGIASVFGGDDTLGFWQTAGNSGALYVDGSANSNGKNFFAIEFASLATADTIVGSGTDDTLAILQPDSVDASVLSNVTGVSALVLSGGSSVLLDTLMASAGIASVFGGEDGCLFHQTDALSLYLDGSAASGTGNVFAFDYSSLIGSDTIVASGLGDTLAILNDDMIDDTFFGSAGGATALSLSGSSAVTLDAAASAAGIASILGGNGSSTIYQTDGDGLGIYLDGSLGGGSANLFLFDSASLVAQDTVVGSGSGDTLSVLGQGSLADELFANVTGVGFLLLSGASAVTLGDVVAASGLASITGGGGDTTITQSAGGFFIDGTASSVSSKNFFLMGSAELIAGDTIVGSGNGDTLVVAQTDTLSDSLFGHVTGVSLLSLTGGSAVTLDSAASSAGIASVFGGEDGSFILQSSGATGSLYLNGAGASTSGNFFAFDHSSMVQGATLVSSTLGDTLGIVLADQVDDSVFGGLSGFKALSLAGGGAVTLGGSAAGAGIASIYGAGAGLTIVHTDADSDALLLDASAVQTGGAALFIVDSPLLAGNDTMVGSSGSDTLALLNGDIFGDDLFADISGVECLTLSGNNNMRLDSLAAATGLLTVFGGGGSTTLVHGAGHTIPLLIDLSAGSGSTVSIEDSLAAVADTIRGGSGSDLLSVLAASSLTDAAFAYKSGLEILQLAGSSSVTLGGNALNAGFQTVSGGAGTLSILQTADETASLFLDGAMSSAAHFILASSSQLTSDTVRGGNGYDTLSLMAGDMDDTMFSRLSALEWVAMAPSSSVTLGSVAFASGVGSVLGGSGSCTISQTADNYNALVLDGGSGTSNLFLLANAGLVSNNTIHGGAGTSTLGITAGDTLEDNAFTNVDGIGVLVMSGSGNAVVLGEKSRRAGIQRAVGGAGDDLFDASSYAASSGAPGVTLDGGGAALSADTLAGSQGADLFVLGGSAGTSYGSTSDGSYDYALITALVSDALMAGANWGDRLQLSETDRAAGLYSLGDYAGGGARTSDHFGIYAGGRFVADITTSGFTVASDGSQDAAFLQSGNHHVTYV